MSGNEFGAFRRLVVKIGSALLVGENGELNRRWLAGLLQDVVELRHGGKQVLIVSSGAVALGCARLDLNRKRARLEELQAAAAAGQVQLVQAYQELLARCDVPVAQVLLTPDDTEIRRRFLNARGTLEKLLEFGVVPVINENDTVATDELRYGDNDRLAARVAQLVMADGLVLLSDVDGLYSADPRKVPSASHIAEVDEINEEIMAAAGESGSRVGSGGMKTKLQGALIAMRAGCSTLIANGAIDRPLQALGEGARCTVFRAAATPTLARKQWLGGMLEVRGELRLDAGATRALQQGNSLLPVGIVDVIGSFRRGDAVMLVSSSGNEFGRGLVAYSSEEALLIRGCRSQDIETRLGYRGRAVVVHRDDLVLFGNSG
jgi:glutamate 5-kinase